MWSGSVGWLAMCGLEEIGKGGWLLLNHVEMVLFLSCSNWWRSMGSFYLWCRLWFGLLHLFFIKFGMSFLLKLLEVNFLLYLMGFLLV